MDRIARPRRRGTRRRLRFGAMIGAGVLLLSACGGSAAGTKLQTSTDGMTKLTVGVLPLADVAPLYLGMQKGFFKNAGIALTLKPAQGGSALIAGVQSGQIPVAYSNIVSVMQAREKRLPLTVVAQGELSMEPNKKPGARTGQSLLVKKDSPIKTVADLSGKTVAVSTLGSIVELLTRAAIDKRGGDSKKVRFIEVPTPQQPPALAAGKVDAVALNEPYGSQAQQQGARAIAHPYTDLSDPASDIAVYFAKESFVKANAALMEKFVGALNQSFTYAQSHLDEVRAIIPSYSQLSPSVVKDVVLPYWTPSINRGSVKEIGDLAVKYGQLKQAPDLDTLLGGVSQ